MVQLSLSSGLGWASFRRRPTVGETAKKGTGMTLQWDKGDKTTGCRRLELQAPTVLPAGLKFIFTPPPRHQSNAASAAGPDCKRAFFCVQHTIRLSCYCQRKATRSSQKHQCLSKEQTPDIRGTGCW